MSDYDRIAEAIVFITRHVSSQPTLEQVATHLHLSPFHFQRLFSRWTGVTPKRYLQILTVERAKQLLAESRSLLDTSDMVGLSSSSRLYDHFIHLEAVTPGEYKQRGKDLTIDYAVHPSPFGNIFIARTSRGICKLCFLDYSNIDEHLAELRNNWPLAVIQENFRGTLSVVDAMFNHRQNPDRPLSLFVSGTNFQINVWKALLQIPPGAVVSYAQVANALGKPRAARAVGTAIGANPVAFLIPCHRVIQKSGKLGGYHWGETRLHAIHAWETAREKQALKGED
jgi:AraC family transcriptional regulator of adaptative response/methylated-DNA-[protein]-cysteine methyltransferase